MQRIEIFESGRSIDDFSCSDLKEASKRNKVQAERERKRYENGN